MSEREGEDATAREVGRRGRQEADRLRATTASESESERERRESAGRRKRTRRENERERAVRTLSLSLSFLSRLAPAIAGGPKLAALGRRGIGKNGKARQLPKGTGRQRGGGGVSQSVTSRAREHSKEEQKK